MGKPMTESSDSEGWDDRRCPEDGTCGTGGQVF